LAGAGGVLHYLVPNVGVTDRTPFGKVAPEGWERVLATNLTVPFFLTQELAGRLRDGGGRIVFIGSMMGIRPHGRNSGRHRRAFHASGRRKDTFR
jgi:3-oxoacyl-[acyl-carrier protein] reductase